MMIFVKIQNSTRPIEFKIFRIKSWMESSEKDKEKKLYIGRLDCQLPPSFYEVYFSRFGKIKKIFIEPSKQSTPEKPLTLGFGYIIFEDHKIYILAKNTKTIINGKVVTVGEESKRPKYGNTRRHERRIIVTNLPPKFRERNLLLFFQHYGKTEELKLSTTSFYGGSEICAIVTFGYVSVAMKIVHNNNYIFQSKKLIIDYLANVEFTPSIKKVTMTHPKTPKKPNTKPKVKDSTNNSNNQQQKIHEAPPDNAVRAEFDDNRGFGTMVSERRDVLRDEVPLGNEDDSIIVINEDYHGVGIESPNYVNLPEYGILNKSSRLKSAFMLEDTFQSIEYKAYLNRLPFNYKIRRITEASCWIYRNVKLD